MTDNTRMTFKDKAILVTGSTRGIGQATARYFLGIGARVAINGRAEDSVASTIAQLGYADQLVPAVGSIESVDGCEAVVSKAIDGLGGLDILVNNAGVYEIASLEASNESIWNRVIDTNVKGTFFCSRAALPALRAVKGTIVNVASVNGLIGFRNSTVYCAAKGAVVNMTRAMALELAPDVRVNCVCPAAVDTEMGRQNLDPSKDLEVAWKELEATRPLQRIAAPEEIAAAIAYLASRDARYITGTALTMDGGITAGV